MPSNYCEKKLAMLFVKPIDSLCSESLFSDCITHLHTCPLGENANADDAGEVAAVLI